MWLQARKIKEGSVYIDSPLLLADLQAQRDQRDTLLSELDSLQARAFSTASEHCEWTGLQLP